MVCKAKKKELNFLRHKTKLQTWLTTEINMLILKFKDKEKTEKRLGPQYTKMRGLYKRNHLSPLPHENNANKMESRAGV